jgi:hypothetical protein
MCIALDLRHSLFLKFLSPLSLPLYLFTPVSSHPSLALCFFPSVSSPVSFPLTQLSVSSHGILLKTLGFPPFGRLWALHETGFPCGREEKARIRAVFLSPSALSFFSHSFFFALSRSFFASRSRARKLEEKRRRPPLQIQYT